jgi:hypothetical protein
MTDSPLGITPGPDPTMGMAVRGAVSLLVKVGAAWDVGDEAKSARLLDRAAGMPFVRQESVWPGPYAAHLILFELLTHTVETSDPDTWFDAVEATAAGLDDEGRTWLGDALSPVVSDWDLGPGLSRLVSDLIGPRPDEHRWMRDTLDPATVRAGTESVLRTAVSLAAELDARDLCSHLAPENW